MKGGARPGAGRPKGSTHKPSLKDYISTEQVEDIIEVARKKSEEGDTTMMKFILDHVFGKAVQPNDVKVQGDLKILFDNVFEDKDGKE